MRLIASLLVVAILFVGAGVNKAVAADNFGALFGVLRVVTAPEKTKVNEPVVDEGLPSDGLLSSKKRAAYFKSHPESYDPRINVANDINVRKLYGAPSREGVFEVEPISMMDRNSGSGRERKRVVWYYDTDSSTKVYVFTVDLYGEASVLEDDYVKETKNYSIPNSTNRTAIK